ncbi:MAG: hypothetical protein HYT80_03645 [Euryarchaeota archaeon]|nr:hypothetical protein [Euryarchaeota archaeon]
MLRWVAVAVVLGGCVEYGTLNVEPFAITFRQEGARLWVEEVTGRPDWSWLVMSVKDCTDPSGDSLIHVGGQWGAVNRGADSKGRALHEVSAAARPSCGAPIEVPITSNSPEARYGDFLEFCTTPKGRGEGNVHDVAVSVTDLGKNPVANVFIGAAIPSCRQ